MQIYGCVNTIYYNKQKAYVECWINAGPAWQTVNQPSSNMRCWYLLELSGQILAFTDTQLL